MALVLVVDDEARVREMLGHAIRMDGHEVLEADSAEAAMKVMEQRPADVVFADIEMPGHGGRWMTIEIRKQYPLTAIVLATGVADLEPTITLRFGVLSYLIKPFQVEGIRKALGIAVEWHEEAVKSGPKVIEHDRLEEWLDSLEIL